MEDKFSMDYRKMAEAGAEMDSRVSDMVVQSFAAAPAAAQAAAGANMNYMTSLALVAAFGQIASAIKTLTQETKEHSKLIKTSAEAVELDDAKRAAKDFNVDTTFSYKRSPGSTNA